MTARMIERTVLGASALVLVGAGLGGVLAPAAFYESYDIAVADAANLSSELRAVGATLVLAGLATVAGAVWVRWTLPSAIVGAVVLLGYASGRTVSLVLDGVPTEALLAAGVIEVVLGAASSWVAIRGRPAGEAHGART